MQKPKIRDLSIAWLLVTKVEMENEGFTYKTRRNQCLKSKYSTDELLIIQMFFSKHSYDVTTASTIQ